MLVLAVYELLRKHFRTCRSASLPQGLGAYSRQWALRASSTGTSSAPLSCACPPRRVVIRFDARWVGAGRAKRTDGGRAAGKGEWTESGQIIDRRDRRAGGEAPAPLLRMSGKLGHHGPRESGQDRAFLAHLAETGGLLSDGLTQRYGKISFPGMALA